MKRHHIVTVIILSLLVPQLATALPRPQDICDTASSAGLPDVGADCLTSQAASEEQVGNTSFVSASNSSGIEVPEPESDFNLVLVRDRQYRFQVSGVWYPEGQSVNPNHQIDAACETTDGVNWSRTGKGGLIVASTYYGDANPEPGKPALACRTDHNYSSIFWRGRGIKETVRIFDDDGNYSQNTGGLTMKIFSLKRVDYTAKISQEVNASVPGTPEIGRVDLDEHGVSQTVTVLDDFKIIEPIRTETTTVVPGELARLDIRTSQSSACPGGRVLTLGGHVGGVPFGPTPGVCGPFNFIGDQTPTVKGEVPAQQIGTTVSSTTLCPNLICKPNTCDVLSIAFFWSSQTGGETKDCTVIVRKEQGPTPLPLLPPGSSVNLSLNWAADTTKLWRTPLNDENPETRETRNSLWAPFHPSQRDWYAQESLAHRLDAGVGFLILGPGGNAIAGTNEPVKIPGLGQVLEAMFTSQLEGH